MKTVTSSKVHQPEAIQNANNQFPTDKQVNMPIYENSLKRRIFDICNHSRLAVCTKRLGRNVGKFFRSCREVTTPSVVIERKQTRSADNCVHPPIETGDCVRETYECPVCFISGSKVYFRTMTCCRKEVCNTCLIRYIVSLVVEITGSSYTCPCCDDHLHPNDVKSVLKSWADNNLLEPIAYDGEVNNETMSQLYNKFEEMSLKQYLNKQPDAVWCPAPGCSYCVVVAEQKSRCPRTICQNEKCLIEFCTNCRTRWHPRVKCKTNAKISKQIINKELLVSGLIKDVKFCPSCSVPISRVQDGSCNQIQCVMCGTRFCWLCMRKASEFHFITPTGCTFWGTEKWSNHKKAFIRFIMLVTAPAIILFFSAVFVPVITVMYPYITITKLIDDKCKNKNPQYKISNFLTKVAIIISSPVVTVMAVSIGIGFSLIYVYFIFPLQLFGKKLRSIMHKIGKQKRIQN